MDSLLSCVFHFEHRRGFPGSARNEECGWGGGRWRWCLRWRGFTFPFTSCQSIKAQSSTVGADRQHRKEQGPATEPPLHGHQSSPAGSELCVTFSRASSPTSSPQHLVSLKDADTRLQLSPSASGHRHAFLFSQEMCSNEEFS